RRTPRRHSRQRSHQRSCSHRRPNLRLPDPNRLDRPNQSPRRGRKNELPMTAATPRGGLLRSNVVVAVGTALSRLTGLIRIMVLSIVIGQNALADAYNSANNSPNTIYELLLGGVLSASLVPLFTRLAEQKDDEG